MSFKNVFTRSASYFNNIYAVALAAMFTALAVIISIIKIPVLPPISYIYLTFIFTGAIGFLFGPVIGAAAGILVDVLGFLINPNGTYFPGFTLTAVFVGVVYGMLLFWFRRQTKTAAFILSVLAAQLIVDIFGHVVLNSVWLHIMYGKAFWVYAGTGVIKNMILWPVESIILIFFLGAVDVAAQKAGAYKKLNF